jgi:hypothetical protein
MMGKNSSYSSTWEKHIDETVDIVKLTDKIQDKTARGIFIQKCLGVPVLEIMYTFSMSKGSVYNYYEKAWREIKENLDTSD